MKKYTFALLFGLFTLLPAFAGASVFPLEAVTKTGVITGIGNVNIATASAEFPLTVLKAKIQQSGTQSETIIECGTEQVAHNYAVDYDSDLMQLKCTSNLSVNKTGAGDSAFYNVVYVPYDIATFSLLNVSSSIDVYNTMTAGDLTIGVFLFAIIMILLLTLFLKYI